MKGATLPSWGWHFPPKLSTKVSVLFGPGLTTGTDIVGNKMYKRFRRSGTSDSAHERVSKRGICSAGYSVDSCEIHFAPKKPTSKALNPCQ